jgi:hypothetical protein
VLEHATVEAAELGCVGLLGVLKALHGALGEEEAKHACMHTPQPVSTPPQEIGLLADPVHKILLTRPSFGQEMEGFILSDIHYFPAGKASPDERQVSLRYNKDF